MIETWCRFHLGDNLAHLHFLRALARRRPDERFIHFVEPCHLDQLGEVVADLPAIQLRGLLEASAPVIDVWKNAGGFWQDHPQRNDYAAFHLDWFAHLAERLGFPRVFDRPGDLLFDYPALDRLKRLRFISRRARNGWDLFDVLVVNSQPCSGQYREYDRVDFLDPLIRELVDAGHSVVVTQKSEVPGVVWTGDMHMSISDIGLLSRRCTHHLMVSTGPSWPTINLWNAEREGVRCLLLDPERVLIDPRIQNFSRLAELREHLQETHLL